MTGAPRSLLCALKIDVCILDAVPFVGRFGDYFCELILVGWEKGVRIRRLCVDEREVELVYHRQRLFVYFGSPSDMNLLLFYLLRLFERIGEGVHNNDALVFPIGITRDDDVGSLGQRRAAVAQNRFERFAAQNERVPTREIAETLHVVGDFPEQHVAFAQFPIAPYRNNSTNYRFLHLVTVL